MHETLEAIRDAWDKTAGDGRDDAKARQLASQYVAKHPDQFTTLSALTLEECVKSVDVFRAAGWLEEQWRVEAWLLHKYPPQNIGGTLTLPASGVPTNG